MCNALNKQVEGEFKSYFIYYAMANWLKERNLDGWAKIMYKYAAEELDHMNKITQFILSNEGHVTAPTSLDLSEIQTNFQSINEILKSSLEHEMDVSKIFVVLKQIATEENDPTTSHFLNQFLEEQVEEEEKFRTLIAELDFGTSNSAVLIMNEHLKDNNN